MEMAARSRAPWGLLGALLILAAVETSQTRRDPGSANELADIWADARERAGSDEVRASGVLCLGDSQIKLGLHAPELGRRLGVPAYNLAVHAGQPAAAYALLRRALDAGARPSAIVVGFDPGVLAYEARVNVRQWPEVLGPLGCLALAIDAGDARLAAMTLLGAASPSYKARDEIRRGLIVALRGGRAAAFDASIRRRRELAEGRGSVVAPSRPEFADDPRPGGVIASDWRPRPENVRNVRRLLALAEARGIAVRWVVPPTSPAERERRRRSGLEAAYYGFLGRLRAEFPGLVVISMSGLELDRTSFVDPIHLDGRGASTLTSAVAAAMTRGGPRGMATGPESPGEPGEPNSPVGAGPDG